MKTNILNTILFAIIILANNSAHATLKRLNNNQGVVADYATIDAALNGQATWDTLYVEPSATTYEIITYTISGHSGTSIILSGHLYAPNRVIIGNGYYLNNGNINYTPPPLQSNKFASKIGANISGQANQYVMIGNYTTCIGLSFDNEVREQLTTIPTTIIDLNIISCLFNAGINFVLTPNYDTYLTNVKIKKCYSEGINFQDNQPLYNFVIYGLDIENNILLGSTSSLNIDYINYFSPLSNIIIRNNIFSKGYECKGAYCANNIFLDTDTTHFNFTDNNLKNNIFVAPAFSLNNTANAVSNQFNVNDSLLFNPFNIVGGPDADYYLWVGNSPAIGAGVPNGSTPVDCGAYGGPDPYKLSGIPPFPTIYTLTTPAVIQGGTSMNIIMSTRSNN